MWPGALAALARQLDAVVRRHRDQRQDHDRRPDRRDPPSGRSPTDREPLRDRTCGRGSRLRSSGHPISGADCDHGLGRAAEAPSSRWMRPRSSQILPKLGRSVIVATNLFRDQLDRYGEADAIVDRWTAAFATAADGSVLVYCADDPRLAMLAERIASVDHRGLRARRDHRPIGSSGRDATDFTADPIACPACGRQLTYAWRSVGHLGSFACPEGHVRRLRSASLRRVAAAAASRRSTLGTSPARRHRSMWAGPARTGGGATRSGRLGQCVQRGRRDRRRRSDRSRSRQQALAIEGYAGPFGRIEWLEIQGRHVAIVLIKNTVSLAETVGLGPFLGADVVLLGLNDAPADGRDVSWIWDGPLAQLVADRSVVLTGSRLDGSRTATPATTWTRRSRRRARSNAVSRSLTAASTCAVDRSPRGGTVVVAASYTAMMGLRAIAQRRGLRLGRPALSHLSTSS